MRISVSLLFLGILSLSLSSCRDNGQSVLPDTPQTVTGTLLSVELSLDRKGTHVIRRGVEDLYYVESSAVDLRKFEGEVVAVTGRLVPNTTPTLLPVLIAEQIVSSTEHVRAVRNDALGIAFHAPEEWLEAASTQGMRFLYHGLQEILNISTHPLTPLPAGTALVIGGLRAVRTQDIQGQTVHITVSGKTLRFRFTPPSSGPLPIEVFHKQFSTLLKSVAFTASASSRTGSGSLSSGAAKHGSPCGGPAYILCPQGQYCEITDWTEDIGHCVSLGR